MILSNRPAGWDWPTTLPSSNDPLFGQSLKVTALYAIMNVPLTLVFALLIALLMNQKVKGIGFFRTVFYLPSVLSGVAVSLLWL
jgi:multiple sugar transport system permease protein